MGSLLKVSSSDRTERIIARLAEGLGSPLKRTERRYINRLSLRWDKTRCRRRYETITSVDLRSGTYIRVS